MTGSSEKTNLRRCLATFGVLLLLLVLGGCFRSGFENFKKRDASIPDSRLFDQGIARDGGTSERRINDSFHPPDRVSPSDQSVVYEDHVALDHRMRDASCEDGGCPDGTMCCTGECRTPCATPPSCDCACVLDTTCCSCITDAPSSCPWGCYVPSCAGCVCS